MVSQKKIKEYALQIAKKYKPEKIILFGSYVSGKPTPESDVDFLIIFSNPVQGLKKAIEIIKESIPPFPIDLIVRSGEEIQTRLNLNDFFLQEVIKTGKVLYESSDS
ncbi:MAG: nucleotidyltransferase domain-containing protein [Candidatus Ozemobacteraceae bacterium]